MSFTIQQINKAKSVPIVEWLAANGHKHVKISTGEYVYYSLFNPDENTPSFRVNPLKNVFRDFSSGRKGDSIRLVQELYKVNFVTAVNRLLEFTGFEILYEPAPMKDRVAGETYSTVKKILPLHSHNLIEYLRNRRINIEIAKSYVNEVHYTNPKGTFYGLGFRNDKGGFEMRCLTRNGNVFKCFVGEKKSITSFEVPDDSISLINGECVRVFEGFTDFLSFLTYFKTPFVTGRTIILNSTSMLTLELIQTLADSDVVYSYLDNDKAGIEAFEKLKKHLPSNCDLINGSQKLYPNHHDFNDFLRAESVPTWQNQRPNSNATKRG